MSDEKNAPIDRDPLLKVMELATLTQNQRLTFSLRYFPEKPWTRKAIGKVIGVSSERVAQIETNAVNILCGTMAFTTGKDLFIERFFAFGNCSISGYNQNQLACFLERNHWFMRLCTREMFQYYVPHCDPDNRLTSDRFQRRLFTIIDHLHDNLPKKDSRVFLNDIRNLSLMLSNGSFDDAFGRALQEFRPSEPRIEPQSKNRTKDVKISM